MSIWLDPSGRSTYGIGLCDRCHQKFSLEDLHPDPNTPGLRVCLADLDIFDPYRLPARQVEDISLPFTRPDSPLIIEDDVVSVTPPPPVLVVNYILGTDDNVTPWKGSEDGVTWFDLTETFRVRSIIWAPELLLWVAVGNEVAYSIDGLVWVDATPIGWSTGEDVAYSPSLGIFVATDSAGAIWYSDDDGVTWQDAVGYTSQTFRGVRWDATFGLFEVVASAGNPSTQRVHSSPDGINFTIRTISAQSWQDVTSNGTRFLATHVLTNIIGQQQSTNGTSWSSAGTTPLGSATSNDYGLGLFMLNGTDGTDNFAQTSATGIGGWSSVSVGLSVTLGSATMVKCDPLNNRWWYVARNQLYMSLDAIGATWGLVLAGTQLRCLGLKSVTVAPIFAIWDSATHNADITLSGGSLTATRGAAAGAWRSVLSTVGKSSGKWYWELTVVNTAPGAVGIDMVGISQAGLGATNFPGSTAASRGWQGRNPGPLTWDNGTFSGAAINYTLGDVIGCELDMDTGDFLMNVNGGAFSVAWTIGAGTFFAAFGGFSNGAAMTANFGAAPFAFVVPPGYNAGLYT